MDVETERDWQAIFEKDYAVRRPGSSNSSPARRSATSIPRG